MKTVLFRLWMVIWGLPQTLLGLILFITNRKEKHFSFHGAVVTAWEKPVGLSLGLFTFIPPKPRFYNKDKYNYTSQELSDRLTVHEYGHCIQSMFLGPLYLLIIGIPSSIWSGLPKYRKLRTQQKVSYFSFYSEKSANRLGEKFSGMKSMETIDI